MDYLITLTGKSGRLLRGTANRLWGFGGGGEARQVCFEDYLREPAQGDPGCGSPPPRPRAPSNPEGPDTGQKKTLDKKDGRRMSFQKPKGTIEYTVLYVPDPEYVSSVESSPSLSPISPLSPTSSEAEFDKTTNPDTVHLKETTPSSAFTAMRPARVVSSTSEEEEAFTEKFLKINCKYITRGKGTVSGVLLVTPNNIMFDPHKTDPLVQENGCEEYGIMCPMEEVMSAAMYKEILDSKIKESLPIEISDQLSGRDFCHLKKVTRSNTDEIDSRIREAGNDSASTAPRSTEESLSEDVFTESELSPIREELVSSDELRQGKSSGASSESVQTVSQSGVQCSAVTSKSATTADQVKSDSGHSASEAGALSLKTDLNNLEMAAKEDQPTDNIQEISGPKEECINTKGNADQDFLNENSPHLEEDKKESTPCGKATEVKQKQTVKEKQGKEQNQDSETEVEELRKLWKTHTMQQTKEQRENIQQVSQKEIKHKIAAVDIEGSALLKEKRRHRLHKFLCLRVGKPMRKTFVSQASATMQQYAQRDKKHEYWFAVPQERTDHLYAFFIQWSPEIYAEDTGEYTREPGFIVVKKIEESETNEDSTNEAAAREWEVVSVAEYHRRIDALNTEELRTLCRRLQITTREDINSKQVAPAKADLESESFRPNLSDPSELLLPDQIEKLTKHLPPRTIGYPWTLVYGTGKHGTSLKTLYRTMTGLDTPVLMVIKDSDGQVFGALASEPFKVSDGFYGTGETFVFTFCPEFEVFKWTGDNMFFIKGDMDSLAFGGGGGEFALWLDGDLYHGRSHSCKTFGNHTLSKKEDFFIQDIEIWAFE
ncbi:oxidation resistance protein 1 isoform X3 [Sturnira hondurensis]|uniref:oxidation resistance protein 1 isoform X3 n=1 Tax=Sturnira hondurensis TaxID=192404 RepID=UPI00187AD019|nr:oxidation resistance protein 1 isoform X3 [Sturnira hondurensis]